jgi:hypothetical protein
VMYSFSQTWIEKIITAGCWQDFQRHNESPMTRVYPRGSRFDSVDDDPILAWNCGCHIVFLNYQMEMKRSGIES